MVRLRSRWDGGYLRYGFYVHGQKLPSLELDSRGIMCLIFSPIWFVNRIFFWKVYKKSGTCEIWIPRKNNFSSEDLEKACEYLEALRKILRRGWDALEINIHNPQVFSGFSLVRISHIGMWGIRKRKISDAEIDQLYDKIEELTETYFPDYSRQETSVGD